MNLPDTPTARAFAVLVGALEKILAEQRGRPGVLVLVGGDPPCIQVTAGQESYTVRLVHEAGDWALPQALLLEGALRRPVAPDSNGSPVATPEAVQARIGAYTGAVCPTCGGGRMVASGTCETCQDCGSTGGCG